MSPSVLHDLAALAAPAAHLEGDLIEVAKGGVALGVHDGVHVLGPADHPQLGDALVGRDDELHPRASRRNQALGGTGTAGTSWTVEGLIGLR